MASAKRILYSDHALERLIERGINDKHLEETIRNPDLQVAGRRGKLRALKRIGSRTLHVVYRELPSMIIVISAYFDG